MLQLRCRQARAVRSVAATWLAPARRSIRFGTGDVSEARFGSTAAKTAIRYLSSTPGSNVVSSGSDPKTHASPAIVPIASQTNGLQHGSTLYGVAQPSRSLDSAASSGSNSGLDPVDAFHIQKTHEHVLTLWRNQRRDGDSERSAVPPSALAILQSSGERAVDFLSDLFLPRDFRKSVSPDYFPYAKWYFAGTIASAASGVLSMQSLLYAIGLGAGSIPTAAAVNWVLKDGLGQFGGVMFASLVNNRYDADPKRWRVASAVSLDLAGLMEIMTPLCPAYFLPMASLANVSKNVSWLSASATRAGFHNSFALRENLADITAKAGSQAIASSIIGTGLGIAVSQFTGAETMNVLGAFLVLASMHQFSVYKALSCVSLRTLNCQRLHLVIDHFLASGATQLPHQDVVGEQEKFMPTLFSGYKSLYTKSMVNGNASLAQISRDSPQELLRLKHFFSDERYLLNLTCVGDNKFRIDVALEDQATSPEALAAHLHAVLIQRKLELASAANDEDARAICRDCYAESKTLSSTFVDLLQHSDWHTENLLVEEKGMRYKWLQQ